MLKMPSANELRLLITIYHFIKLIDWYEFSIRFNNRVAWNSSWLAHFLAVAWIAQYYVCLTKQLPIVGQCSKFIGWHYKGLQVTFACLVWNMASLPCELLAIIFAEHANDSSTLHSCTLVNRNWCVVALQYLWAKPFTLLSSNPRRGPSQSDNLITTFVECFTDVDVLVTALRIRKKYRKKFPFDYSLKGDWLWGDLQFVD